MTLPDSINTALIAAATVCIPTVSWFIIGALKTLARKWNFDAVAQNVQNLNQDVHTSIAAGIAQLPPDLAKAEWHDPLKQTAILATSASYMEQHFPDRVKEITGQIPSAVPSAVLHEVIAARLPAAIAVAAASPATPDVKA